MKLIEIINFNAFYEAVKDKALSFKTSYKLAKIAKAVEVETEFYREKFREIILECAELDENGAPITTDDGEGIKLRPGTEGECAQKINELQTMEVEFPDIKLTLDEFDGIDLTIDQVKAALPLFE